MLLLRVLQTLGSLSSGVFWHLLQMGECLRNGPKLPKSYFGIIFKNLFLHIQRLLWIFLSTRHQARSWHKQSLSNFCYSSSLGKYTHYCSNPRVGGDGSLLRILSWIVFTPISLRSLPNLMHSCGFIMGYVSTTSKFLPLRQTARLKSWPRYPRT